MQTANMGDTFRIPCVIAALMLLASGCDNRHVLGAIDGGQPSPGNGGSAGSLTGGGVAGAAGTAPSGIACNCAPSSGINVLSCGQGFPTSSGRDAPHAMVSARGDAVVFNRCAPGASGGCTSDIVRWTAAAGATKLGSGWAYAVSADGATILADTGDGSTGSSHPVAWRDGTFIEMGLNGAFARLLSADGSVVAARVETSVGVTQAVLRSVVGGAMTMLGDLPTGPEWSEPNAINADGTAVVGYGNTTGGQEPFVWTATSGQMVNLGAVGDVVDQTVARATNADGTAVVGTSLTRGGTAIFHWTPTGGIKGFAYHYANVPSGGPFSVFFLWSPPLLINSVGDVVMGTQANPSNPAQPLAFRWTSAGGVVPLTLPTEPSIVRAASQDGSRLLGTRVQPSSGPPPVLPTTPPTYTPFIWDTLRGTRDLVTVLAAAGQDIGGLTLGDPIAMSADGTTVVGHATCGTNAVIYRAVLSTP
jgi:hypothetical protein